MAQIWRKNPCIVALCTGGNMETWEKILVGAIGLLVLLLVRPGIKKAFEQTSKASRSDWMGLLFPLGLVVLFVILLLSFA